MSLKLESSRLADMKMLDLLNKYIKVFIKAKNGFNPVRRQTKNDILASLIHCFQILRIQEYLQMANKLPSLSLSWYTTYIYSHKRTFNK